MFRLSAEEAVINATTHELEKMAYQQEYLTEDILSDNKKHLTILAEHISSNGVAEENIVYFC